MIGECPTCGHPVFDLTAGTRRDDRTLGDGRTEALATAEPCGHDVLVRYRSDSVFTALDDPELVEP
jgi:hypothetical protein